MFGLIQACIMASSIRTTTVQSSAESHLLGQLSSPIPSFPLRVGFSMKNLCSQSLNLENSLKHCIFNAPSKNSVYLTYFKRLQVFSATNKQNTLPSTISQEHWTRLVNQASSSKEPGITYLTTWSGLKMPSVFLEIKHWSKVSQQRQSDPVTNIPAVCAGAQYGLKSLTCLPSIRRVPIDFCSIFTLF